MVLFLRRELLEEEEEEEEEEAPESDSGSIEWLTGGILGRIATGVYSGTNYKS